jgi:hypothetical protein
MATFFGFPISLFGGKRAKSTGSMLKSSSSLRLEVLEGRTVPKAPGILNPVLPVGVTPIILSPVGSATGVQILGTDDKEIANLDPYPGYRGPILTAVADVNGDRVMDIITAPGGNGYPAIIKVYNGANLNTLLGNFCAYAPNYLGGVSLTIGDLNGDNLKEIITGTSAGQAPHVKAFNYAGGQMSSFFAYASTYLGGVKVAVGDLDGDRKGEIITWANGTPHVKAFKPNATQVSSFYAYASTYAGPMTVTAGDLNADLKFEIITVGGPGPSAVIRTFNKGGVKLSEWIPNAGFNGATRLIAKDIDADNKAEIITSMTAPGGPFVKIFAGNSVELRNGLVYPFGNMLGVNISLASPKTGTGWDIIVAPASATMGATPQVKRFAATNLNTALTTYDVPDSDFNRGIVLSVI